MSLSVEIESPVTKGAAKLLDTILAEEIIAIYDQKLSFDVEPFLPVSEIGLYECLDTTYRFYAPSRIEAPPAFYEQLYARRENLDWSYSANKWEFETALKFIDESTRLIDIGCGSGAFLSGAMQNCAYAEGLELNDYGRALAIKNGLLVHGDNISSFSRGRRGEFDVLTCFQVLEHVYDVGEFLNCCIDLIKIGGVIVIAVPNNTSFISRQSLPLNMPPHHVGLWSQNALKKLQHFFPLSLVDSWNEPLENVDWYIAHMMEAITENNRLLSSLYHRSGLRRRLKEFVLSERQAILGHTALIVFQKES